MSFSEFYQRSINEPEQFWAEQARVLTGRRPLRKTLDHSNPPFARWFCEGRTTCVTTLSTAGWRNSQRRWH